MKELNELNLPDDIRYSDDHEWAKKAGDTFKIGISDYAQDQLGDIVYVELPQVGASFDRKQQCGTIESVKAVSEMYMPIGGEVIDVNPELVNAPELINKEPYGKGWMFEVKPSQTSEYDQLMDKKAYLEMLKGLK
jgi:glycine cleavage system H protein